MDTENIILLMDIISKNPRNFTQILTGKNGKYLSIVNWIKEQTPLLSDDRHTLLTRIFWILNGLKDFPICYNEKCGSRMVDFNVKRLTKGYPKYCSPRCSSIGSLQKRQRTCVEKYGVDNPSKNQLVVEKIRDINIKKYGTACPARNSEIQANIRKRNLEKYGVEYYQSTDEFKEKVRNTCNEKYGVDCVLKVDAVRKKCENTMLERYGVTHNSKSKVLRKRMFDNLHEKYGDDFTNVVWGGRGNVGQNRRAYSFILRNPDIKPLFSEEEYVEWKKSNPKHEFPFECRHCGTKFTSIWDNGMPNTVCPKCTTRCGISSIEKDVVNFLKTIYKGEIIENDRKIIYPYEIDIVIPERKLCIEVDGVYWHSDIFHPDRRYHLMKTKMCNDVGYSLIHVFDAEWIHKNEIVKSRIASALGVYDNTIYARDCDVRTVSANDACAFLDENHLQGRCGSSVRLGLYYNGELISLMTFGKPRYSTKYEWELIRFCSKKRLHVTGAASRLLVHFERDYKPSSLVSYADRRWSSGNVYHQLGFTLEHETQPNHWYVDFSKLELISRIKCQKHKLWKFLKDFDPKKSEYENMKFNGFGCIYDCGNLCFSKKNTLTF